MTCSRTVRASGAAIVVLATVLASGTARAQSESRLPDSTIQGTQILPHQAVVRTGQSLELRIVSCDDDKKPVDDAGEIRLPMPPGYYRCDAAPAAGAVHREWSVNGALGGSAEFGRITYVGDGKAVYTAPDRIPSRPVVSISAEGRGDGGLVDGKFLLVASITIEDRPDCSAYRSVRAFDVDLRVDPFTYAGSGNDHRVAGRQSAHMRIRVKKILDAGTERMLMMMGKLPSLDVWHSHPDPVLAGGQVTMDDTDVYAPPEGGGYTHRVTGSGQPHTGTDAPSLVALKVDYDTCMFDLVASFTVRGTFNGDGGRPVGAGGLYLIGQLIHADQAKACTLQGSLGIAVQRDIDVTGYTPGQTAPLTSMSGATTAHWAVTPVP